MPTPFDDDHNPPRNYGPYGTEDAALRVIVEKLVQGLNPRAVFLFGSRAEQRARPDSDFDLVVVVDDNASEECTTYEGVYAPLCGSGIGCDVIPCRASELDEVLSTPPRKLVTITLRQTLRRVKTRRST